MAAKPGKNKTLELEGEKVSFTGISFQGQEGWITGEPSILLHTEDGGASWSRIPLSEKLPGAPFGVVALAPQSAEMVTNLGAIYKTTDGGHSWKALVEGSVGVARTIFAIAPKVATSQFPPEVISIPLGNPDRPNGHPIIVILPVVCKPWVTAVTDGFGCSRRGGQLQFSTADDFEQWDEAVYPELSTSWGLLDLAYRNPEEIWVAGGSANLLVSSDGGATWQKDRAVENVPSNFYKVLFTSPEQGFVLGQSGYLLKYNPPTKTT